ncbi:unnamed protein product [Moneuplotes crassus]|uniref:Uncharacterized protein n=2 Tax=Euplotes crassus TaxID=5936 RepID=A0AAD1U7I5_EUPCR|nr:unnamed protein product [Moneuplotes crassus]
MKKFSRSGDHPLKGTERRRVMQSVNPSGSLFDKYGIRATQKYKNNRNLAKIYCPSQRTNNHTENKGKMRTKLHCVSEERDFAIQNGQNQLPDLTNQKSKVKRKSKPAYRSHNVSQKRGKMNSHYPSAERSEENMINNFIFAVGENPDPYQDPHPSIFSSNVMSKRNKTGERGNIPNRLIYKRQIKKRNDSQRKNIDINDRFIFYQKSPNINQPQLEQFKQSTSAVQNERIESFQVQGSQIGNVMSPAPKPVIVQKSKVLNHAKPMGIAQFGKSSKYDAIYKQPMARQNFKKSFHDRRSKKTSSYFISPYDNKSVKNKTFYKKGNKEPRSTSTSWSNQMVMNDRIKQYKASKSPNMFNFQKKAPCDATDAGSSQKAATKAKKPSLQPIKKIPVPKISGIESLSPVSQGSPNIKKMENSIFKIQGMLKHMDDLLVPRHVKANSELLKIDQEADSGRVDSSFQMPQNSGRESDLVTLLNIEDASSSVV